MITNAYISTFKYHSFLFYESKENQGKRLGLKHLTLVRTTKQLRTDYT